MSIEELMQKSFEALSRYIEHPTKANKKLWQEAQKEEDKEHDRLYRQYTKPTGNKGNGQQ